MELIDLLKKYEIRDEKRMLKYIREMINYIIIEKQNNSNFSEEEKLKNILLRFNYYLSRGDGRNKAQLVDELDSLLEEALRLVYLDHSNHLFHQTDYHIHYFEMRQSQSRILRNMAQQINTCQLAASETLILAQLFSKIAGQLSQTNPASSLLDDIERFLEVFRNRSLPKTREEFETRATLLQLLREAKTFIQVKVDFYKKYGN